VITDVVTVIAKLVRVIEAIVNFATVEEARNSEKVDDSLEARH
jgi:hypothetical protein